MNERRLPPMVTPRLVATFALHALRGLAMLLPPVLLIATTVAAGPKGKVTAKTTSDAALDADAAHDAGPKETVIVSHADASAAPPLTSTKSTKELDDGGVRESERKEGDASVKVFEFGTSEIQGKSRWPAVTYFTRRLRAEFDTQALPHRSFLPELAATAGQGAVK